MLYINTNKLENINFNKKNFYVVIDFDKTLTSNNSVGSWGVLENSQIFSEDFVNDSRKLMEKYYPYEIDYTLEFDKKEKYIEKWYYENMNLFYQYGLTHEILLKCMKESKLEFRTGAKQFLNFLYQNNIPVLIISAGIGNIIEEFLKMNDCYYDNIYIISNFIKFKNNLMLKFSNHIIHSLNKKIQNLPINFEKELSNKEYILLIGDLIEDILMVPKKDLSKTLTIGFLETKIKQNLEFYNQNFDVVFTESASFNDVKNLILK